MNSEDLHDAGSKVIYLFRVGMTAKANDEFAKLIDGFIDLFSNFSGSVSLVEMNSVLEEIMTSQMTGDYLYVADLIEYKLLKLIAND